MRRGILGLVARDTELEIGVVFVGAFSFLSFPSSYGVSCGGAAFWVVLNRDVLYGEGSGVFAAEDLDSALRVDFLQAVFFGGFFCGGGCFIASDSGDVVLVVDVPGFLS
jgi:hypothetical protein